MDVTAGDVGLSEDTAAGRELITETIDTGLPHLLRLAGEVLFKVIFALEIIMRDTPGAAFLIVFQREHFRLQEAGDGEHFLDVVGKPAIEGLDDVTLNHQRDFID